MPDASSAKPSGDDTRHTLELKHVRHTFGDTVAVDDVSFVARRGEFLSLLGPSGCGKTTTLSMIAGFLNATSGAIHIEGRRVDHLAPEKRNTGMVFQNYALFPHMSVSENVGFGLRMRGVKGEAADRRVREALRMVRIENFADRRPNQLSGGQQQRVALARAMVIKPDLLLLDEPFGALDRQLREDMQRELKTLQRSVQLATVFVTHDQDEALSMSDRIAVMNNGNIEQIDAPSIIYEYPETIFVARFVGKSNLFNGTLIEAGPTHSVVDSEVGRLILPALGQAPAPGTDVQCLVRPGNIRCTPAAASVDPGAGSVCAAQGLINDAVYRGGISEAHIAIGEYSMLAETAPNIDLHSLSASVAGSGTIRVEWNADDTRIYVNGRLRRWKHVY
ncbi:ABC transporter ATP-binding protein [Castellaniella sp.]|uniref:ABC transporter ATP-binding protein n=1 Tax=Castellaniella sp. TaxID=1955812 RepID=UPI003C789EC6